MNNDDILFTGFIGCFLGFFIGGTVCGFAHKSIMSDFKKQALDRGYAEFKSDKDGNAVFTWREPNAKQD